MDPRHAGPGCGNRPHPARNYLNLNTESAQPGKYLIQFTVAHKRLATYYRNMNRAVSADQRRHLFHEFGAAKVFKAGYTPAIAHVSGGKRVAPRTPQRTFFRNLYREKRGPSAKYTPPHPKNIGLLHRAHPSATCAVISCSFAAGARTLDIVSRPALNISFSIQHQTGRWGIAQRSYVMQPAALSGPLSRLCIRAAAAARRSAARRLVAPAPPLRRGGRTIAFNRPPGILRLFQLLKTSITLCLAASRDRVPGRVRSRGDERAVDIPLASPATACRTGRNP